MRKIILIVALMLVLLVPVILFAVQGQQEYTVLMLVCGGTHDSNDVHIGQFDSLDAAKAWADSEMQGHWDIAYVYDIYPNDGSQNLLWARSESWCYPDMDEWTRF